MKDSGIPWIGEIPEGWGVNKLKYLTFMKSGEAIPASEIEESGEFPVYGGNGLRGFANRFTHDGFHLLIGRQGALCGNVHHADGKFWASEHAVVVTMIEKCDGNWIYYLLSAMKLNQYSESAAQPGISVDKVRNLSVPLPNTTEEQKKIAGYLDSRCGEIDRVIAAKERQNERLRDQRAAVIHEAVTKGLNPKAKFKESGYEWIGRVPEDWNVLKLRYVGSCQNGISKSGDLFGSGLPFVSYGDVYQNEVLPESVAGLVESTPEDQENYSVRVGDVFFTRTSETIEEIGLTSVCMKTIEKATFAGFLIRFRPFVGMLDKMFSKYYFRCIMHRGFFVKEMNIVTRASLGQDLLKKLPVLLPSLPEQRQIAAHLDARCGEIDRVMAANEGMVAKLKEYRASLIWEAVTGKKCL